ncbi:Type III restriction enzyme, res subunit:DEAD/DEAH box helicase, N- terminal [Desulfovibrio sp. DV]|uniref:TOTE conflict system archaeo-eukaryotic primase domain-containing protein n=1 Tax=Desulfovibrio sp. DV TaxID=1844708 RepID=UPI00094B8990|nr:hypothetical protein [Desulfovibrio sp. DV]OLN30694.1 Type III restriction enzyme, res subunit:DEAD/DEAH box helicase, N- terminal [Desulfovibrio sp. DV]
MRAELIPLLRSLYNGRQDVVPRRWEFNGGRAGYSPMCSVRQTVECPITRARKTGGETRGLCKHCGIKQYQPLTDDLVQKHLDGREVLGCYPLLAGGMCNFIVGDFDNHGGDRDPKKDVLAVSEVAEVQELAFYIFTSRSGAGFHGVLFFDAPVPAWKTRPVYFALLEEAQVLADDAELGSFDRLIPMQDQLRGGADLGNLVAMPYQGAAVKRGFTLLLDPSTMEPFTDQVAALKGIKRLTEADLDRIITEWNLKRPEPGAKGQSGASCGGQPTVDASPGKRKYAEKVLQTSCEKIRRSKPGDQHDMRLKTARTVGGYLHYIDEGAAMAALRQAVVDSGAQDIAAAMQTIRDGLEYGKAEPITIADHTRSDTPGHASPLVEHDGRLCRVKFTDKGEAEFKPVTSFLFRPIEAISVDGEGEYIRADLVAGAVNREVMLPPDCWTSTQKFLRVLPGREFIFTGAAVDVQLVRGFLAGKAMAQRRGVRTAGFQDNTFVTSEGGLTPEGPADDLVYINEIQTPCRLLSTEAASSDDLAAIRENITGFNAPEVVLLILGWSVACFFAPVIRAILDAFPLICVEGEAGAGKTSTVNAVVAGIWALYGAARALGEQTRFTLMRAVDGSNSIPLVFEENKASRMSEKQQNLVSNLIRDSYNAFEGQRGMADQSMRSYRYQAPVCILGETGFTETAILDRMVNVSMTRRASAPYRAGFQKMQRLPLDRLGRTVLEFALRMDKETVAGLLRDCWRDVDASLEDRPRNNAAVVRFGLGVLGEVLGMTFDAAPVDAAILAGTSDDGGPRKSAVDRILEAMGRMSAFTERSQGREFAFQDHLESDVHYYTDGQHLRLHVAGSYPVFAKWARVHGFDGDVIPEATFRKQVQGEGYCLGVGSIWMGTRSRKGITLNVSAMLEKGLDVPEEWANQSLTN